MSGFMNGDSQDVRLEVDAERITKVLTYLAAKGMDVTLRGKTGDALGRFKLARITGRGEQAGVRTAAEAGARILLEGPLSEGDLHAGLRGI